MKIKQLIPLALVAGLLLGAGQPASDPVDELIAQNLEARGGLEKIRAVNTMIMTGTIDMDMGGQEMSMMVTIYKKRPGKMRTEVTIPSMGMEVVNGFDGEVAWMDNPMQGGVQKMPEGQVEQVRNQANLDGVFVDYKAHGVHIEYAGEGEVRGRAVHKLKVVRADSSESIVYLDAETHLEAKIESKAVNPQNGQEVMSETFLSDYRDVDGLKVAFSVEVSAGGLKQHLTFTEIKVNAEAEDGLFAYPGE